MRDWMHVYLSGYKKEKQLWAYARAGTERPQLKSTNRDWIIMHADYRARVNSLLLMIHEPNGQVQEYREFRVGTYHMGISRDFKTHYNVTMANKLQVELPNLKDSVNVKEVSVRAKWPASGSDEPEKLVVVVLMHDGKKVKINTVRYMFPNSQVIAQVGLLI